MKKIVLSFLVLVGSWGNAQQLLEVLQPTGIDLTESKCIERVKDKYYGDGDHNFIYCAVMGPNGKKWLNLNLGAEYAKESSPYFNPEAQPTDYNDWKAFGSLFQEGRKADGHELVRYYHKNIDPSFFLNDTDNNDYWYVERAKGTYYTPIDPINSYPPVYILGRDWMADRSNIHNLWAGEMLNNPCPNGYRIMNAMDIRSILVDDHTKIKDDPNQTLFTASLFKNIDYPNVIIMTTPVAYSIIYESHEHRLQKTLTMYGRSDYGNTSSLWLMDRADTREIYGYNYKREPYYWNKVVVNHDDSIASYYSIFDNGIFEAPEPSEWGYGADRKFSSQAIRCVEK